MFIMHEEPVLDGGSNHGKRRMRPHGVDGRHSGLTSNILSSDPNLPDAVRAKDAKAKGKGKAKPKQHMQPTNHSLALLRLAFNFLHHLGNQLLRLQTLLLEQHLPLRLLPLGTLSCGDF
jgi:hypothetical protein